MWHVLGKSLLGASRRRAGRLTGDEKGTTLIEFGLLALPFFGIITAILETSFIFLASNVLDGATDYGSRMVRTGQAQKAGFTIAEFRSAMCDRLFGLFDCGAVKIRVHTVTDFTTASIGYPIDPTDGTWVATETYTPGSGGQIVIVEAYYKWPTLLNILSLDLSNTADNSRLLSSVRAFKNEPF